MIICLALVAVGSPLPERRIHGGPILGEQAPIRTNRENTCLCTCCRCPAFRLLPCSRRAEDEQSAVICLKGRTVNYKAALGHQIALGHGNYKERALPQTSWCSATQALLILGKDIYVLCRRSSSHALMAQTEAQVVDSSLNRLALLCEQRRFCNQMRTH
jgi:hypothetical protein